MLAALSVLPSSPAVFVLKRPRLTSLFGINPQKAERSLDELNSRRHQTATGVRSVSENRKWYRESVPLVDRKLAGREPYDVVFATYGGHGSVWLGRHLVSKGFARNLIVDFRDLMDQPGPFFPLRLFKRLQQEKATRRGDSVTVISEGLRDNLRDGLVRNKHGEKISVLYNGFVPREMEAGPRVTPDNTLRIAYTGSLYRGRRDASPLFQALGALLDNEYDLPIEVHYAGPSGEVFRAAARAHGVSCLAFDHGVLPRAEALRLQEDADLLLALSWNTRGSEGILSGKFPEYLGAGKPIISIVAGDLPNAELTRLVNEMSVGVSVEEVTAERDIEKLSRYLRRCLDAKKAGVPVPHDPVADEVAAFNYETLTDTLEAIIAGLGSGQRKKNFPLLKSLLKSSQR